MGTIEARIQHLILESTGEKPLKAPAGVKPGDSEWRNYYIMVGEWAYNQPDDIWYYNNGTEVKAFGNVGNEVIDVENTALYDALKPNDSNGFAYYAGKDFVTFVNEASANPDFHDIEVYLCIENASIGESPESHPAKWKSKGDTVEVERGSLSKLFFNGTSAIKEITDYKNGDNAIDNYSGRIYTYRESATTGLQPLNNPNPSGRWVAGKRANFSNGAGIIHPTINGSSFTIPINHALIATYGPGSVDIKSEETGDLITTINFTAPCFIIRTGEATFEQAPFGYGGDATSFEETLIFRDLEIFEFTKSQSFKLTSVVSESGVTASIKLHGTSTNYVMNETVTAFGRLDITVDILGAITVKGKLV